ncbi:hypothetical protein QFC22_006511 [Naganishia vaughanmartiniae]|uniref:Uncharacterized protein n=1 Tax=Naganishia vaughanmartiniae TaxID=1424756 RepID=A0ACC2WJT6_9TREE|nr:hypothetical protein QFC22_006511 [Naganishia vaughanmartiniae]
MVLGQALARRQHKEKLRLERSNQPRPDLNPRLLQLAAELNFLFQGFWLKELGLMEIDSLVRKLFPNMGERELSAKTSAMFSSLKEKANGRPVRFTLLIHTIFPEAGDNGKIVGSIGANLQICMDFIEEFRTTELTVELREKHKIAFRKISHGLALFRQGERFYDFEIWLKVLFPASILAPWRELRLRADDFIRLEPKRISWRGPRKYFSTSPRASQAFLNEKRHLLGNLAPFEVLRGTIEVMQRQRSQEPTPDTMPSTLLSSNCRLATSEIVSPTSIRATSQVVTSAENGPHESFISYEAQDRQKGRRDSVVSECASATFVSPEASIFENGTQSTAAWALGNEQTMVTSPLSPSTLLSSNCRLATSEIVSPTSIRATSQVVTSAENGPHESFISYEAQDRQKGRRDSVVSECASATFVSPEASIFENGTQSTAAWALGNEQTMVTSPLSHLA